MSSLKEYSPMYFFLIILFFHLLNLYNRIQYEASEKIKYKLFLKVAVKVISVFTVVLIFLFLFISFIILSLSLFIRVIRKTLHLELVFSGERVSKKVVDLSL